MASDAGLSAVTGKRDYAAVKTALEKAGYQGEKVVLMGATDQPTIIPSPKSPRTCSSGLV